MPTNADDRPINRRQLLVLAVAAVAVGCEERDAETPSTAPAPRADLDPGVFDVGPLDAYDVAQVYAEHRDDKFFVIRRDGEVFALSAVCTHRSCLVHAQADGSFKCKCHGSAFSPTGQVLKGPAQQDLPRLAVKLDDRGYLLVKKERSLDS